MQQRILGIGNAIQWMIEPYCNNYDLEINYIKKWNDRTLLIFFKILVHIVFKTKCVKNNYLKN